MLERMAEQPIDPRYDPAFQRGFSGDVATGSRADAAPRSAGTRASGAPHVTSALHRPVAEPRGAHPRAEGGAGGGPGERIGLPPEETIASAEPAAAAQLAVVRIESPALRPPWTNPFAIVVAILGIAALGTGIWLTQQAFRLATESQSFTTQVDYVFLQWSMWGGPVFLGAGVVTIAALLLFCAGYWARRPALDEQG